MTRKARGHQGSWFAYVGETRYPCVHRRFLHGLDYHDPAEGEPLPAEYVEAVQAGLVILTRSRLTPDGNYERSGYIALFAIEHVTFRGGELRFRLADRLEDLK